MNDSDSTQSLAIETGSDPRLATLARIQLPLYLFDAEVLVIAWANQHAIEFWEADSLTELCSRDMSTDVSPSVKQTLRQIKQNCFEKDMTVLECWTVYPNQSPKTANFLMTPFKTTDNRSLLLMQVQMLEHVLDDETLYRTTALMHTTTMISAYDTANNLVYCNGAARDAIPADLSVGTKRLVKSEDAARIMTALSERQYCDIEAQMYTKNGIRWHSVHIERCTNPTTGKQMYLATETDITEQRNAKEQAFKLAFVDSLTNLPNRVALMNQLTSLLASSESSHFAVMFLDLDRFKNINDSLGHAVGDLLLIQVAERLSESVRGEGSVFRLSGDEFIIILAETEAATVSSTVANRILGSMAKHMFIGEHQLLIRTSIGISLCPENANSANELLEQADAAMYAAKASQCGYCFFNSRMSMTSASDIKQRMGIENDLLRAIENNEFELYYQPKIACETMTVCGVEALVRWNHPELGTLAPDRFINIAEECGQIVQLGNWVLNEAMRQQRRWQDDGLEIQVSINISAKQFESNQLDIDILDALQLHDCDPRMIELEVTESMLAGDPEGVYELLQRISALGMRLTLDDFGTGYSNLAYLQNYPLDSMKIDRLFLSDSKHSILLRTILNMGKTLGLDIVAEGVETAAQVDWLVKQGCDQMQGFYFSKPKPARDITRYLCGTSLIAADTNNAANDHDQAA